MPELWEPEINAVKIKLTDLEKIVTDLTRELRENPKDKSILADLAAAKEEISELKRQLSQGSPRKEGTPDEEDFWPI